MIGLGSQIFIVFGVHACGILPIKYQKMNH